MGDVFMFRLPLLFARAGRRASCRSEARGFCQFHAALITEMASDNIFITTLRAALLHLSGGHCHKKTFAPLDDLDISDDKLAIECQRGVGLELLVLPLFEKNPDFRDFQFSLLSPLLP